MLFLAFNNTDFQFGAEQLTRRTYTIAIALSTTSQVKLIDKKEFVKVVLDKNSETFIIYILAIEIITIYPFRAIGITDL